MSLHHPRAPLRPSDCVDLSFAHGALAEDSRDLAGLFSITDVVGAADEVTVSLPLEIINYSGADVTTHGGGPICGHFCEGHTLKVPHAIFHSFQTGPRNRGKTQEVIFVIQEDSMPSRQIFDSLYKERSHKRHSKPGGFLSVMGGGGGGVVMGLLSLVACGAGMTPNVDPASQPLENIQREKASRSTIQQKISSELLHAFIVHPGGAGSDEAPPRQSRIKIEKDGTTLVDIKAEVTEEVLTQIRALGGMVINSVLKYHAIRARVHPEQLESLAALPQIQFIRAASRARTRGGPIPHERINSP